MTSLFRHSQPSSLIWSSWNNARFCMFLKYIWFLSLFQDHAREHPQITLEHQKQNIQFLRDCQPQAAACTSSSLSFSVCVFCLGTSQWQSAMSGQSMTSILSPSRNETTGKMEHIQCQYIPIGTKKKHDFTHTMQVLIIRSMWFKDWGCHESAFDRWTGWWF